MHTAKRTSRVLYDAAPAAPLKEEDEDEDEDDADAPADDHEMDVEVVLEAEAETSLIGEQEVEAMVGVEDSDSEVEETAKVDVPKPARVWPEVSTEHAARYRKEIDAIRESFEDEADVYDTTMVSEYAEEIFEYMEELEVCLRPRPRPRAPC